MSSGFSQLRRAYVRLIAFGAITLFLGIVFAALIGGPSTWAVLSIAGAVGLYGVGLGVWGLRIGSAASVLTTSINLLQAGKLAQASALLDAVERNRSPTVVRARELQRAMIAVRLGNLAEAERKADLALVASLGILDKTTAHIQRNAALGLRAWVRAASGDFDGARVDIDAVRAAPIRESSALAHASLAEAVLLERNGDRAGLAALLRRDRRLLMGGLDLRERSVVRAMQRLLKTAPTSVYRTPAERKAAAAAEGEPSIAEWLGRVAPELADFVPGFVSQRSRSAGAPSDAAPPPELRPSAEAVARVQAEAAKKPARRIGRVVLLWAGVVMIFLAIWQLLPQEARITASMPSLAEDAASPLSALWGVGMGVFLVGLLMWVVRRNQKQMRRVFELGTAVVRGENVDAELADLASSKREVIAAQAELLRAGVADRRGQLAAALSHVDAGRAKLRTEGSRTAAAPVLSPQLTATRAYVLAALGRADESAAELQVLPSDYLLLDRTRFSVRLIALVARGDLDGAGRLVDATSPDLSIGPRDELVRDLVRAATAPSGAGAAEIARLRDELREDDESRQWIAAVAPGLLERFERATTADEAGHEAEAAREAEAESEALAEEEAVAERSQSQRKPT